MRKSFPDNAMTALNDEMAAVRCLSYQEACSLPETRGSSIGYGKNRCQITIYRQTDVPGFDNAVLVTVQLSKTGVLGVATYTTEEGVIFFETGGNRDADVVELLASGG